MGVHALAVDIHSKVPVFIQHFVDFLNRHLFLGKPLTVWAIAVIMLGIMGLGVLFVGFILLLGQRGHAGR